MEELRKQRQEEEEELDEKCALIDKKARDAQRVQDAAHRERETYSTERPKQMYSYEGTGGRDS